MTMKNLLEKDFITHYGLTVSITVNVVSTNNERFDLRDDAALVCLFGSGIAKYENPTRKEVNIINYEHFFKSLPQSFQQNRKNCDLFVYTSDKQYFLLNELTNKGKKKGKKRVHAIRQMLETLEIISNVPAIQSFIQQYSIRQCCYFNKKSQAPMPVNATVIFNTIDTISEEEPTLSNEKRFDKFHFEFCEFSGTHACLL
jgi:hypothetical protein